MRGGKREGAGRPKTKCRKVLFLADEESAAILDAQPNKSAFILSSIKQAARNMETLGAVVPASSVGEVRLPFFDINLVAGFPIPLDNDELSQDIELLKMLCPHPESSYLIRVKGESMVDAGVQSGDIVIVDKSNRHPSEHEMAVCELNGEYTLKQVVRREGVMFLVPANDQFPEIEIRPEDAFSVWGTVTYIIHKARL